VARRAPRERNIPAALPEFDDGHIFDLRPDGIGEFVDAHTVLIAIVKPRARAASAWGGNSYAATGRPCQPFSLAA
jgi:hypothetical protein